MTTNPLDPGANWCPECGERSDVCQCGFPPRVGIWDFESEIYEWDWNDVDWPDEDQADYDYTEGDIGQDGEI